MISLYYSQVNQTTLHLEITTMIADRRGKFIQHFGTVCSAAGTRGWGIEGYRHHKWLKPLGYHWPGFVTPISKTATLRGTAGNAPLDSEGMSPKEFMPRCVVVNLWTASAMNAVALSSSPVAHYLEKRIWQRLTQPFIISFMPITDDPIGETREFTDILLQYAPEMQAPWGIQYNPSCPNRHLDPAALLGKSLDIIEILARLRVDISIKLSAIASPELAISLAEHPSTTAITFGNTIPHGDPRIAWERHGWEKSPLTRRGFDRPGALSSPDCTPFTIDRIMAVTDAGIKVDVFGGNGIYFPKTAKRVLDAGASGIEYGMGATVRTPWMVPTLEFAHQYAKERQEV